MTQPQTFDGLDEFYELQETAPTVYEGEVFGRSETDDGDDQWEKFPYRRSLWIEGGGMVGDVSSNEEYYHIIQYEDVLDAIGAAFSTHGVEPRGYLQYSDSGHKLMGYADLPDAQVEVVDGDVIDLGLQFSTGQTGFHGLHYDAAGMREICSNGMKAPVAELEFGQTHQESLQYSLPQQAVAAILDGTDLVEDRLQAARQQTFVNQDEAVLTLLDIGLDRYFENPVLTLEECLEQETGQSRAVSREVTLYDAYNTATRALTHHAELSMEQRDAALDRAASLLDRAGELPDAEKLGQRAIENRVRGYTDDEAEVDAYWDDEEQTLADLIEERGDTG